MSTHTGSRSAKAVEASPRRTATSRSSDGHRADPTFQTPVGRRSVSRLSPLRWSIAARSAFVAGAVVFIALTLAGAALTVALYQALLAGVDDAAARRGGGHGAPQGVD